MHNLTSRALCAAAVILGSISAATATELPKATKAALTELKLESSIMDGLDAELDVPKAWTDGAAQEKGAVIILGTWQDAEFRRITEAFVERYPSIKLNYARSTSAARGMKVLMALSAGRAIADVITSVGDSYGEFKEQKALADLRDLPGVKNLAADHIDAEGSWVAHKIGFRCMSYNTDLVKTADLPKTWDDLLNNPAWRGGKIALSNTPNAWLLALWSEKGEDWGRQFTKRLFTELQPQQRKEGMMAVTGLAVAGEFYANIPAPERRVEQYASKGAPIGYHCPEPVPITLSQIVMLEKAERKNGARIFINWLISREGQILQFVANASVPVHKDLQDPRFIPFSETIVGKPSIARGEDMFGDIVTRMDEAWNAHWTK
ncbi:MAG: ABC transporter substrate-binding protein [Alphaproteobacteria bacterium]